MNSAKTSKPACVYQIKVTLQRSQPSIWRRIQVKSSITLHKLHQVLQIVMDWGDEHAHQFIINNILYDTSNQAYHGLVQTEDEREYRLNQLIPAEKFRFKYEYDFGDSWEHLLLVEKVLPLQKEVLYPVCLEGRCACPPEDIGGIFGYYHFLEIIGDPKHPKYDEMRGWVSKDFDPEKFDVKEANRQLRRLT